MGTWEFRYPSPYNPSPIGDAGWRLGELWVLLAANLTSSSVKKKPCLKRVNERVDRMRYLCPLHMHIHVYMSIYTHTHILYSIHLYHRTYTREGERERDREGVGLKSYVQKVTRGLENMSKQFNLSTAAGPLRQEWRTNQRGRQASNHEKVCLLRNVNIITSKFWKALKDLQL